MSSKYQIQLFGSFLYFSWSCLAGYTQFDRLKIDQVVVGTSVGAFKLQSNSRLGGESSCLREYGIEDFFNPIRIREDYTA